MINHNDMTNLHNEINKMIEFISKELITEFDKTKTEAMKMIRDSKVEESLIEDELGFHESPYNWAISILTDQNDHEALEKHFYH